MQAIQIVGFKNSGKTTLALDLAQALTRLGRRVACVKFSRHGLDKADTDTARMLELGLPVAGVGPEQAAVFWPRPRGLGELVPLLDAEVLVVEGGKALGRMPRVLVLREPEEARELGADLALASFGSVAAPGLRQVTDVDALAELVLGQGFLLPGLDCGNCGRENCRAMAREIVAGQAAMADCAALGAKLVITVNGAPVAVNSFVERIITASITGMLKELKGWSPGPVHIRLET